MNKMEQLEVALMLKEASFLSSLMGRLGKVLGGTKPPITPSLARKPPANMSLAQWNKMRNEPLKPGALKPSGPIQKIQPQLPTPGLENALTRPINRA